MNNDFAAPQVISGRSGTIAGTDAFATVEPHEPRNWHGNTVWFSWTAPRTEDVRFEIDRETLTHDTVLSVWEGSSVDDLDIVRESDDFFGRASALSFRATAGTAYRVRVSGFCCGDMGALTSTGIPAPSSSERTGTTSLPGRPVTTTSSGSRVTTSSAAAPAATR